MTILLLAITLLLPSISNAQDLTYQQAYQDYLHAQEVYSKEHDEYLLAKSQYSQAGTLAAETKAREETAQMLASRDDVISTYLQAVRMLLLETQGVNETIRSGLSSRLEAEMNWYRDHRNRVSSAGSLQDSESDSTEAKERYDATTVPLVYETLIVVPNTRVAELRKELSLVVTNVQDLIHAVEAKGTHDVSNADRWMIQIDGKMSRSLDKEIEAQNQLQVLQNPSNRTNFGTVYTNSINYITESHQFLKEASTFLQEVMRLIRTKN